MYKIFVATLSLFVILFGQVDYISDIQPILTNNCGACHISNSSAGLNLSTYENTMSGSSNGQVVIPYDYANSELYIRIILEESTSGDMPPSGSLTQGEIDLIAQWIDEGALEQSAVNSGCTDPEAYNCVDDDGINYTFEIGEIQYVNGCNYQLNDYLEIEYLGGCEDGPCEGYYDEGAVSDDGSCDYYQAPNGSDVVFTVEDDGIWVDWSNFTPPSNATVLGYHVQRCTENCVFITGMAFPWNDTNIGTTSTSVFDEYVWEPGYEIKYAINVKYSNAENYGMAIGASYVTPGDCSAGDMNGDFLFNVLDIVSLANCVLAESCQDIPNGNAGDMNGDSLFNVLDIVSLANCVLSESCGCN